MAGRGHAATRAEQTEDRTIGRAPDGRLCPSAIQLEEHDARERASIGDVDVLLENEPPPETRLRSTRLDSTRLHMHGSPSSRNRLVSQGVPREKPKKKYLLHKGGSPCPSAAQRNATHRRKRCLCRTDGRKKRKKNMVCEPGRARPGDASALCSCFFLHLLLRLYPLLLPDLVVYSSSTPQRVLLVVCVRACRGDTASSLLRARLRDWGGVRGPSYRANQRPIASRYWSAVWREQDTKGECAPVGRIVRSRHCFFFHGPRCRYESISSVERPPHCRSAVSLTAYI